MLGKQADEDDYEEDAGYGYEDEYGDDYGYEEDYYDTKSNKKSNKLFEYGELEDEKELYPPLQNKPKSSPSKMESTCKFNHHIDKQPKRRSGDRPNQNAGMPVGEAHGFGIPVESSLPIHDSGIEEAYKKLKIENLDLQAEIEKLKKDSKGDDGLQTKCKNYEKTIKKYKGIIDFIGGELGDVIHGNATPGHEPRVDNETINELKSMVRELQEEKDELEEKIRLLTQQNKELNKKSKKLSVLKASE